MARFDPSGEAWSNIAMLLQDKLRKRDRPRRGLPERRGAYVTVRNRGSLTGIGQTPHPHRFSIGRCTSATGAG